MITKLKKISGLIESAFIPTHAHIDYQPIREMALSS